MKQIILISALLFFANWSLANGYACPDTLITGTQTYQCGTVSPSHVFDSSSFTVPAGQTSLTISFDIKVTDLCSVSAPQALVTASVGSGIPLFFTINNNQKSLVGTKTQDGTLRAIATLNDVSPLNKWITMIGTIDTSTNTVGGAILISNDGGSLSSPMTGLVKPTSTMKISVCSDVGGTDRIGCEIGNFKVIYNTFNQDSLFDLLFGTEPMLVGLYKFKEGAGYTTKNGVAGLGNAYFGDSTSSNTDTTNSPSWQGTDQALVFNTKTKYLTLPTFSPAKSNNRPKTLSFSLHFWFKTTATPSNAGDTIFSYMASDKTTNRLSLIITDAMDMQAVIGPIVLKKNTPVTFSASTWTEVIASFSILDEMQDNAYVSIDFGTTNALYGASAIPSVMTTTFQTSDIIRIGGFIGQIADLRIYSPGAFHINAASCTSGCPFDLGTTNPATCFQPDCGAGSFASSCISCPSSCTSCSANNVCRTCPVGSGLSGGSCSACPSDLPAPTPSSPCKVKNSFVLGGSDPETHTYSSSTSSVSVNIGAIIGIAVGAVAVVAITVGGCIYYRNKRMRQRRFNAVSNTSPQAPPPHMNTTRPGAITEMKAQIGDNSSLRIYDA